MDLCADVPMEGLHMEVQAIQESMQLLSDKLDHARLVHIYSFKVSDRNIGSRTDGSRIL